MSFGAASLRLLLPAGGVYLSFAQKNRYVASYAWWHIRQALVTTISGGLGAAAAAGQQAVRYAPIVLRNLSLMANP